DDKKRLALPKRLRDSVGDKAQLFVAPGQDQCLWIYDQERLESLADKLDQTPATDAEARVFRPLFFPPMEALELHPRGRILIPDRLVEFAGLTHEVVLLGVRDHLELWDAQRWQAYMQENGPQFDKVAEGAFHK